MTVMFRPDRHGDRQEIVFELGDPWSTNPTNLDAYKVQIFRRGRPPSPTIGTRAIFGYFGYTRGVLMIARQLGVAAALPSLTWIDGEWRRIIESGKGSVAYKRHHRTHASKRAIKSYAACHRAA
jgi:hypothetical protein